MLKPTEKNKQQKLSAVDQDKKKGKVWDCSQNLKIRNQHYDFLTDNLYSVLRHLETSNQIKVKHEEFFKLFFIDKSQRQQLIPAENLELYNDFINSVKTA